MRIIALRAVFTLSALLILASPKEANAQQTAPRESIQITLSSALELAASNNFDIRIAQKELESMKAQRNQSNALFLPTIVFEETAVSTNDPLNVFGFKLKQEVVTAADFNPADLNDPDAFDNFTTKLSIQQPLINPDKWLERTAAGYMVQSTKEALKHQQFYTEFQVKDAYFKFELTAQQVEINQEAVTTAAAFQQQALHFYEQDLISKSEYLAAQVHHLQAESALAEAAHQHEEAADQLAFLLGFEAGTPFEIEPAISTFAEEYAAPTMAFAENSMLRSIGLQRSAAQKMSASSKATFLPSLNVFGSLEYNDDTFFGFNANSYMIGASLRWEIFGGYSKIATIAQRTAEYKKADIAYESASQQFKLQARKAQRTINQAATQQRFSETGITQAEEELNVRNDRFNEGLERTSDVLASQTKLAGAKLQHLQIIYMRNIGIALLEYLHETDFTN